MNQRVPTLVYHHVLNDDHPDLAMSPGRKASGVIGATELRRHLNYLAAENWQVISTTDLVEWLRQDKMIPDRAVVLHFDNGWLDTYTIARPILKDFGLTATCYLISTVTEAAATDQPLAVRTSTEGTVTQPGINWRQARELLADGWEIGAHTATHRRLAKLHRMEGDAGLVNEIDGSHETYREALNFVPDHFAYPSGSRSKRTDAILRQYYRSLRRWEFTHGQPWKFTDRYTSPLALEAQNVDHSVSFDDFSRIFEEARLI